MPLQDSVTPQFDKIQAEHVVPGIKALLAELNANLDELEKTVQPTWEGLVEPLERLSDKIERTWGAVSHLKVCEPSSAGSSILLLPAPFLTQKLGIISPLLCRTVQLHTISINVTRKHAMQAVKDSEPLRTAVDEVQPERVKLSLRLSQSKPLYEAFKGIKEGKLWGQLSEAQQRIVDGELRDFVLGGVALEVCCRSIRPAPRRPTQYMQACFHPMVITNKDPPFCDAPTQQCNAFQRAGIFRTNQTIQTLLLTSNHLSVSDIASLYLPKVGKCYVNASTIVSVCTVLSRANMF